MSLDTGLTFALLALAVVPVSLNLRALWGTRKSGWDWKIPFQGALGVLAGNAAAICAGGLIGRATEIVMGAGNWAARFVPWATGTTNQDLPTATTGGLEITGGLVCLVITIFNIVVIRGAEGGDKVKRRRIGGTFVGIVVTYSPAGADLANTYVVPLYNQIGQRLLDLATSTF